MNNLKIEVTPEEFVKIEKIDDKLVVIYKAMVGQQKHCDEICVDNESKFSDLNKKCEKLDKRKKVDTTIASTLGFLGGFIASWFRKFL